ncbi:hypothetical protein SISSUDRAFT_1052601 [Sistotremastrum suecicum HHB10207 ss-3]|uniref:Uncharacterized protein n=1 Tax=Sistotremastrum suecicum HHB10207 ss-3 TaxID=1314776 RepID=A0A165ZRK0_9AGAM|nr:hypothetical protein SISSUDRAFT_1052601 [Sistotremastrum suecicum HHB10207 ss-3]
MRSGGLPLTITLHSRGEFPKDAPELHGERLFKVREMTLDFELQDSNSRSKFAASVLKDFGSVAKILDTMSNSSAPLLTNLTLRFKLHTQKESDGRDFPCIVKDFFLANSQNLCHLKLEGFTVPYLKEHTTLKGIRFLSFNRPAGMTQIAYPFDPLSHRVQLACLSEIHDFLSHTPEIEELEVEEISDSWKNSSGATVELNKLHRIYLSLSDPTANNAITSPRRFLSAIECPRLAELHIACAGILREHAFASYADLPDFIQEFVQRAKSLYFTQSYEGRVLAVHFSLDPSGSSFCSFRADLKDRQRFYPRHWEPVNPIKLRKNALCEELEIHPTVQSIKNDLPKISPQTLSVKDLFYYCSFEPRDSMNTPGTLESCQTLLNLYPSITTLELGDRTFETRRNLLRALHDPSVCPKLQQLELNGGQRDMEEIRITFSNRKARGFILTKLYLFGGDTPVYLYADTRDSLERIPLDCVDQFFTDCHRFVDEEDQDEDESGEGDSETDEEDEE